MEINPVVVELQFPIEGRRLPADHGYLLYGGISRILPEVHAATDIGIHTIPGVPDGNGQIQLSGTQFLKIRLPLERVPQLYRLAGKSVVVGNQRIVLGAPRIMPLSPSLSVRSRLVLIKKKDAPKGTSAEPTSFLQLVKDQLQRLNISGEVSLESASSGEGREPFARRVLTVKGTKLTGYGVVISGLNDADSLLLQMHGIGGRRKMGCGLFVPISSAS